MWFDEIIFIFRLLHRFFFFWQVSLVRCFAAMMTDDTLDTKSLAIGRDVVNAIFGASATDAECVTFYNPFRQHTYAVH